ncbi:hypothetical protein QQ045_033681 [Rhodiola kirilowii]
MVSGQRINMEKSEVVFSRNTPADVRQDVVNLLRIGQVDSHSKYLGLPLIVGQRKTETFHCITEKIWRKMGDWKGKLLSMVGKEVLIKAVVQTIPMYMMSVYYFPQKNLDDIAKLIGQYWWNKNGRKGISWLSREVMYRKKEGGGIGFKDLRIFNEAILMKICWRMLTQPQLLVSKVLKAWYCQNSDLSYASLKGRLSHIWRGVMKNIQLFWSGQEWNENRSAVVWKMASSGEFSVKTAYDLISNNRASVHQIEYPSRERAGLSGDSRSNRVYCDCSWGPFNEFMGLVIAVIGQDGEVLRVQADIVKRSSCVSEGEGLALLGGMRLASLMGFNRFCFETDSAEVYRAICLGWGATGWCNSWIVEATHLLDSHERWSIGLIGREQNVLADTLAFKARQEDWC